MAFIKMYTRKEHNEITFISISKVEVEAILFNK